MKDKENQIEEMAKVLCINDNFQCNTCPSMEKCFNYSHAKKLYNAGYQKLPEDTVVLSREEYEELKQSKKDKQLAYFGWEDALNSLKGLNADLKQISKKTAEKIYKEYLCDILSLKAKEEFAKQFGVEIKE